MTYIHQFWAAKGGQGTSTVAAAVAVLNAQAGNRTLLVSNIGTHVVGSDVENLTIETQWGPESAYRRAAHKQLFDVIILDGDDDIGKDWEINHTSLVTTQCYLALRAATSQMDSIDDIVLMDQPGRALQGRDIENALGGKIAATVSWTPTVARCVDAGLLGIRLPGSLRRELQGFVVNNNEEND